MTASAPETKTELLERSVEVLRARIPSTWRLIAQDEYELSVGRRPDARGLRADDDRRVR